VTYFNSSLSIRPPDIAVSYPHPIDWFFVPNDPILPTFNATFPDGSIHCPAIHMELRYDYRGDPDKGTVMNNET